VTKAVVPEYLPAEQLARLSGAFEVVYDPDLHADRAALLAELAGAEAVLIRNRTRIDSELLASAARLRIVGRLGVGLDNIDLTACSKAGVAVIPAIGVNAVSVAEYVMGAMLVLVRGVFSMTAAMVAGEWPRQGHAFGRELRGKTLGLVGFGAIARHVAERAAAFEMRVMAFDPGVPAGDPAWRSAERVDLDQLVADADVISLHTPLTDETRNLIGPSMIEKMRPGTVLINTARGGIVDEDALARALRDRRLGGAAIDVFASEPLRGEDAARFAGIDNLILSPHLAGNSHEAVDEVADMIVDAVIGALQP
jgi:(S)-sulfolactate dehydrogenase